MKEKARAAGEKIKELSGKLGKKTWAALGAALAVVLIAAVIVTVVLNNMPYEVLFTGLSSQEAASIVQYLENNGVTEYRLENSNTILVPRGQEARLKANLLMEGYPQSGFSYGTYFEKAGALSTEAERNKAFLIALQERMEAVLRCFEGVKDAAVTIVPGEDRRYILDDSNMVEATASVLLTMQPGKQLSSKQADAIRNLIARAVQGLQIDNVSITDTLGNTYSAEEGGRVSADASQLKLQLEEQESNKIRANIMQVLGPLYGEDNVRVGVNCTVDVSQVTEDSIDYKEPEGWPQDGSTNGKGIIGSKVYDNTIVRGTDGAPGGVAGTESNSEFNEYVENYQPDGNENTLKSTGQVDYKVGEKKSQVTRTAGVLSDVMVSVSLNATAVGAVDNQAILTHVARAAGISDDVAGGKISILVNPFYAPDAPPVVIGQQPVPTWVLASAGAGLLLFLIILMVILKIRKRRRLKRLLAEQEAAGVFDPLLLMQQAKTGADVMSIQTEKSMELRKDIRQFADDNPEIAAQMVKAWLKGGDEGG